MNYGNVKAASTFAAGSNLPGNTTTVNSWRTQFPLTGSYPSGNWTFAFSLIGNGATLDGTGNLNLRVNRGPLQGPPTTSILGLTAMPSVSNLTTATAQNVTLTVSMPAITLQQEYLFFACAWVITVASTNASSGVVFVQDGTNSIITPTTFVPAPPAGIITSGSGSSTNMGSQANPMYPQGGAVDSYLPPQQWLQAGGPVRQHLSSSGGPALSMGFGPKASITKTGGIVHVGGPPNNAAGTANQQATGIVSPVMLPPIAELPPIQTLENGRSLGTSGGFAGQVSTGFGQAAQPPVVYSDVMSVPPTADLPPPQSLPFGKRGGSGVTAGRAALGGFNSLSLGAGVFVGPAEIVSNIFLPPLVPELPYPQYNLAGVVPVQAVVLDNIYLPPVVPDLPVPVQLADGGTYNPTTGGAISGGRGTNLKVLITVPNDLTQRFFTTTTAATSGRAVAPFLIKFAPADYVDVPPDTSIFAGFGNAAQNGTIIDNIFLPPIADLPPTDYVTPGHGQAAQAPKIVFPDLLPPSTELPPLPELLRGFGQAAQPPVIVVGPPDARSPWPTTTAELLAGFGQAAQTPKIVFPDLLPPSAELPPLPEVLLGVRPQARAVVLQATLAPPLAALPPTPVLLSPTPTKAGTVMRVPLLPELAQLPPEPILVRGFGKPSQPPVVYFGLPAPEALLPPRPEIVTGFGHASQAAVIVQAFLLPPTTELPPPSFLVMGHGSLPAPVYIYVRATPLYLSVQVTPLDPTVKAKPLYLVAEAEPVGPEVDVTARPLKPSN